MLSSSRLLLACWLLLVGLSVASVQLAGSGISMLLAALVLLAALAKAWLISDGFMELRHAPWLWRMLLFGWALVMALGIFLSLLCARS
ncbi:cytochrome C oxidase subunit IV family protein [Pseudomonas leptonychotis]|uniref:cytochrome C oxidase subunit IV family protein n=1 Tax=Pseudomonas leptonychotis TaxID=2448482 RepID=UPI0039EE286E